MSTYVFRQKLLILNKYTGSARKRRFVWAQYLADENAVMAPPEAFYELTGLNPFPGLNEFQKGMVLEGVDPKHQALICPLAVSEVSSHFSQSDFFILPVSSYDLANQLLSIFKRSEDFEYVFIFAGTVTDTTSGPMPTAL